MRKTKSKMRLRLKPLPKLIGGVRMIGRGSRLLGLAASSYEGQISQKLRSSMATPRSLKLEQPDSADIGDSMISSSKSSSSSHSLPFSDERKLINRRLTASVTMAQEKLFTKVQSGSRVEQGTYSNGIVEIPGWATDTEIRFVMRNAVTA